MEDTINLGGEEHGRTLLSEEGEKELTKLWRTWKTVNEMLVDRVRSVCTLVWT